MASMVAASEPNVPSACRCPRIHCTACCVRAAKTGDLSQASAARAVVSIRSDSPPLPAWAVPRVHVAVFGLRGGQLVQKPVAGEFVAGIHGRCRRQGHDVGIVGFCAQGDCPLHVGLGFRGLDLRLPALRHAQAK